MRVMPLACLAGPTPPQQLRCWRSTHGCLPAPLIGSRHPYLVCRAATAESSAEWGRLSSTDDRAACATAAGGTRPLLLDDASLVQASAELQELCMQQLQLLSSALQLSLQAGLTSSISINSSIDEEVLHQHRLADSGGLRSTVYFRSPASLQTGQLTLQLVAVSGGSSSLHLRQQQQQEQQQRFLFLGQNGEAGSSLAEQEQWILEQQVIVLPDSGGLVLPLAHNGFLVGLLVVEQYMEDEQQQQQQQQSPAAAPGTDDARMAGSSSTNGAGMPQPPACLLFRSAELQLLKQTAAVLSLACAMDLRAALERVGAAYRQRQASALVQAAKKPLSVMRTLGTMLLPRLQPGEPDRDFAQGILEQGTRLQEVVQQLQAALHPAATASVVPPALLQAAAGAKRQRMALPLGGDSSNGAAAGSIDAGDSGQWQLAEPARGRRPALPSSSTGSDYQWGSTIDMSVDAQTCSAVPSASPSTSESSNGTSSGSSSSNSDLPVFGSRASADLLNVLMPLLASASNFAAVSGVSFVMAEHCSGAEHSAATGAASGGATVAAASQQQHLMLPAAEVAVGPGKLKRMLSQLIDGVMACGARGDLVQASVLRQQWQGRAGVAISLCCCYSLAHGSSAVSSSSKAGASLSCPPLQPEFAFLQGSARNAGGYFEVIADATPDVQHLNSSALTATLWLPVVSSEAAWS